MNDLTEFILIYARIVSSGIYPDICKSANATPVHKRSLELSGRFQVNPKVSIIKTMLDMEQKHIISVSH